MEYFVSNLCESYSSSSDRKSCEMLAALYLLNCLAHGESKQKYFDVMSEWLFFTDFMNIVLHTYSRQKSHKAHFRKVADKSLKHN